ncbi:MerR family transcriptional regulator [Candidatus Margulisiibacteriota bacterium]
MFTIGEFSKITKLTAKTLRYYDEIGLLSPGRQEDNEYRVYSAQDIEKAGIISKLKELGFSLKHIQEIVKNYSDDEDIEEYLLHQIEKLNNEISGNIKRIKKIKQIIRKDKTMKTNETQSEVQTKDIPDMLIAAIRYKGAYSDSGKLYGQLGKACGMNICGPAGMLVHDECFQEEADFEAFMPLKKAMGPAGPIEVKTLKGGKAISIIHNGPYETLGDSYKKIIEYINENSLKTKLPSREIFLKGPGIIFRGNPNKFVTEIQYLVE